MCATTATTSKKNWKKHTIGHKTKWNNRVSYKFSIESTRNAHSLTLTLIHTKFDGRNFILLLLLLLPTMMMMRMIILFLFWIIIYYLLNRFLSLFAYCLSFVLVVVVVVFYRLLFFSPFWGIVCRWWILTCLISRYCMTFFLLFYSA